MSSQQAAGNKGLKDTIYNWFFTELSVMCRHNAGSFHELAAFLCLNDL